MEQLSYSLIGWLLVGGQFLSEGAATEKAGAFLVVFWPCGGAVMLCSQPSLISLCAPSLTASSAKHTHFFHFQLECCVTEFSRVYIIAVSRVGGWDGWATEENVLNVPEGQSLDRVSFISITITWYFISSLTESTGLLNDLFVLSYVSFQYWSLLWLWFHQLWNVQITPRHLVLIY